MPTVPAPAISRTARVRRGGFRLWLTLAALLVLAGGWAAKAYYVDGGQPKNILLMGVDLDKTRTDVVLLAHIDPRQGIVNLLSIPRDTWVNIPCAGLKTCQSPDKLAHAHAWGGDRGPEVAVKTVEGFLGVPIDGYARVDYAGFQGVIDRLGGVNILIDKNMDYEDPTPPGLYIHFKASPQPQHLSGQKALEYVRFRADGLGDIGRTERTRKFLHAVLESAQQNGKLSQLPSMWKDLSPYVTTDLDAGTYAALARTLGRVKNSDIRMEMVPGTPVTLESGPWIWQADAAKTQVLVDTLITHPTPPAHK